MRTKTLPSLIAKLTKGPVPAAEIDAMYAGQDAQRDSDLSWLKVRGFRVITDDGVVRLGMPDPSVRRYPRKSAHGREAAARSFVRPASSRFGHPRR